MSIFNLFSKAKNFVPAKRPVSWIVAGLGNPGPKYENTRHNAGFLALDTLAKKLGVPVKKLRFKGVCGEGVLGDQGILLLKPQTFINLSGESVAEAARFYKIPPQRVVVLCDDMALPPARLRIRGKGSDGGHNGLKSIIYHLNSSEFPRVRIGIGTPAHPEYERADWVLSRFAGKEAEEMAKACEKAAGAVCALILSGPDAAMQQYNGG